MADNLDQDTLTGKEKRQQKKSERQQRREERVTRQLGEETGRYGIDLSTVSTPTESRKEKLFEEIKQAAPKELVSDIERYSERYTEPTPVDTPELDEEAMRRQIKRERRLRWADALMGFGAGLQGRTYDQGLVDQSKTKREQQLKQYRDVVESNRQRQAQWEANTRREMIDYLENKIKEGKMSELEGKKVQAQVDKMKAEEAKVKAQTRTEAARAKYYLSRAAKEADTAKKEVDKGKSATYKYKTKDGREMSLSVTDPNMAATLTNAITESERLKDERDKIQEQMDNAIYEAESTGVLGFGKSKEEVQEEVRAKYQPLVDAANEKVRQSEASITSIFEGGQAPVRQFRTQQPTIDTRSEEKTPLDDILENL